MIGDEAARDVDALLLAARKGCGRKRPQFPWQVQLRKQRRRLFARIFGGHLAGQKRFGNDIDGSDTRHGAQELADITDRVMANFEDRPRRGIADINDLIPVADEDLPLAFVVLVENGGGGADAAGPIAARLLAQAAETAE